jgi:hypothetical protein
LTKTRLWRVLVVLGLVVRGTVLGVTVVIGIAILVGMLLALGLAIVVGVAVWMVARSRDGLKFRQAFGMLLSRSEKPSEQ